jgi:hypothetical protein
MKLKIKLTWQKAVRQAVRRSTCIMVLRGKAAAA